MASSLKNLRMRWKALRYLKARRVRFASLKVVFGWKVAKVVIQGLACGLWRWKDDNGER